MADSNRSPRPANLLLLETDPGLRRSIRLTFEQEGVAVWEAPDEESARALLKSHSLDVIVLDHENKAEGLGELIDLYRSSEDAPGAVLVTTARRLDDRWRQQYRPDSVIYKPFDVRFLYRRICSLLQPT